MKATTNVSDEIERLKADNRDLENRLEELVTAVHFSLLDMARGENESARERLVGAYFDPSEMDAALRPAAWGQGR